MKTLIIFDSTGMESARFTIPQVLVNLRMDYGFVQFKFQPLNKKNHVKYESWDVITEPNNAANN